MDFALNEEQRMLVDEIKRFCDREYPVEKLMKDDEEERMPIEFFKRWGELGWVALPFPKEYGGLGGNIMDEYLICESLSHYGGGLGALYFQTVCFGGKTLEYSGSEEQKQDYLRKLCSGDLLCSLACTESEGGTDILGACKTTAVQEGDEFVINGEKMFITGADEADYLMTVVRTSKPDPEKKSAGFSLIMVPAKAPGVTANLLRKHGGHVMSTAEIFFDNVKVPVSNLLGERDKGVKYLVKTLNNERVLIAAICNGSAMATFELALNYAKQRMAFGRVIGQFQIIQSYLADVSTEIDASRLLSYKAAWMLSQGDPAISESAKAKMYAAEMFVKTAQVGMRIFGGAGWLKENAIGRAYRDSVLFLMVPISNEMCKNMIAMVEFGLPPSYKMF